MKDNFIFILISLLTFNVVMGDNPIFIPAVKDSSPSPSGSIPSNSNSSVSEIESRSSFLVLGFRKISIDLFIVFYVYTRISFDYSGNLTLKASASSGNLRLLDEATIEFNCTPINDNDNQFENKENKTFNCSRNNLEGYKEIIVDINTIEMNGLNANISSSAKLTNNLNLNNDLIELIYNKVLLDMECKNILTDKNNIYIEGTFTEGTNFKEDNPYLLLVNNDNSSDNVPCDFENINVNVYNLTLSPTKKIDANLHEQIVINGDQIAILNFVAGNGNVAWPPSNKMIKKSSSGLSTGGIVAIVIPCIAVLLAVAGLAFILGNKTKPPVQNIENTTIGINSSSEIKNK